MSDKNINFSTLHDPPFHINISHFYLNLRQRLSNSWFLYTSIHIVLKLKSSLDQTEKFVQNSFYLDVIDHVLRGAC